MKPLVFVGDSRAKLRRFPDSARGDAGFQLRRVQEGIDPRDWKPMNVIGPGAREIRVRDSAGAFRVIYVANFAEAIYVLHAFQKKSQRTSQEDVALAKLRYRGLKQGL
jgi:phage-related protein